MLLPAVLASPEPAPGAAPLVFCFPALARDAHAALAALAASGAPPVALSVPSGPGGRPGVLLPIASASALQDAALVAASLVHICQRKCGSAAAGIARPAALAAAASLASALQDQEPRLTRAVLRVISSAAPAALAQQPSGAVPAFLLAALAPPDPHPSASADGPPPWPQHRTSAFDRQIAAALVELLGACPRAIVQRGEARAPSRARSRAPLASRTHTDARAAPSSGTAVCCAGEESSS